MNFLQSHLMINLYLQSMNQFQRSLLTLPSKLMFLLLVRYIRWAEFLARTKPQRMKARSVLSGLAAEASHALSCLDAQPLQPWSIHGFHSTCQLPNLQQTLCLQWSTKAHVAAPHFWQKAEHRNDTAIDCICPRSSHPAAPCCVKRENCKTLAPKSFCYSSVYSFWFLTILISKWKYYSGAISPNNPTQIPEHIITFSSSPFEVK